MFWLILANWLPNYYSWFSWMFLLKLSLWRRSLSHKLPIDLQEKSMRFVFIWWRHKNYVKPEWMSSTIFQNMLVMLKKRLDLRRFLASFVNFCVTISFETFCELLFKLLDECFYTFYCWTSVTVNKYSPKKSTPQ